MKETRDKKIVRILALTLAFVVVLSGCGSAKDNTKQEETSEVVEQMEEVVSNDTTDTEAGNEETVEVNGTEDIEETEAPQSLELTYEDFECAYNGYTNYIDFDIENPDNYGIQIVYPDVADDEYILRAEHDVTNRGLKLGDSRERVLELYGDYDKQVTYRNMRLKSGDLIPEENYIYYLKDPKPTTFDGLYAIFITLDRDGNVIAIAYGGAESKYM